MLFNDYYDIFFRNYEATGFKLISKSIIRVTFCMCPSQCLVVRGEEVGNGTFCSSRFTPCGMWSFFKRQNASFGRRILTASGKNGGRIMEFFYRNSYSLFALSNSNYLFIDPKIIVPNSTFNITEIIFICCKETLFRIFVTSDL